MDKTYWLSVLPPLLKIIIASWSKKIIPSLLIGFFHSLTFFNLKELKITETELKLMAAAAIIGLKRIPKNG